MKNPCWIVGIDEVGRGPLAGAVYVCAVAMPYGQYKKTRWDKLGKDLGVALNDSKKMTAGGREIWSAKARILETESTLHISLASQGANTIDTKGIAVCIRLCIKKILLDLKMEHGVEPSECLVLLDGGLKAPTEYTRQQTVIKGDSKHPIISLASVVAKVARDKKMVTLHKKYPEYDWGENKGYGTKKHVIAIKRYGKTLLHRNSFLTRLLPE